MTVSRYKLVTLRGISFVQGGSQRHRIVHSLHLESLRCQVRLPFWFVAMETWILSGVKQQLTYVRDAESTRRFAARKGNLLVIVASCWSRASIGRARRGDISIKVTVIWFCGSDLVLA